MDQGMTSTPIRTVTAQYVTLPHAHASLVTPRVTSTLLFALVLVACGVCGALARKYHTTTQRKG